MKLSQDAVIDARLVLEEQQKHAESVKPHHTDTSNTNDFMKYPNRTLPRPSIQTLRDAAHTRIRRENQKVR